MDNNELRSGTPGYMAPEVMLGQNHSFSADYFALGVIAYECVTGKRPYKGKTQEAIRDKMMKEQVVLEVKEPWDDYSEEAVDFINKCLSKDRSNRISSLQEVKQHPWF
jgi:serine/threonine protein kinase